MNHVATPTGNIQNIQQLTGSPATDKSEQGSAVEQRPSSEGSLL